MRRPSKQVRKALSPSARLARTVPSHRRRAAAAIAEASIVEKMHSPAAHHLRQEDIATIVMHQKSAKPKTPRPAEGRANRPVKMNHKGNINRAAHPYGGRSPRGVRYQATRSPSIFATIVTIVAALVIGVGLASLVSDVAAKRVKNFVTMIEQSETVERGKHALRLDGHSKQDKQQKKTINSRK